MITSNESFGIVTYLSYRMTS